MALWAASCVAGTLVMVPTAEATLTFTLNNGNLALQGGSTPPPYGTVTVDLVNSTTAQVVLTADSGYSFGDGGLIALNLTGTGLSYSFVSGTLYYGGGAASGADYSQENGGDNSEDGFGDFTFKLNTVSQAANYSLSRLTIDVTTTGSWGSEADILALNSKGFAAGGHVFADNVLVGSPGSPLTGYAVAVPEAGTVLAGILLFLPLGASTLRILRKNRVM